MERTDPLGSRTHLSGTTRQKSGRNQYRSRHLRTRTSTCLPRGQPKPGAARCSCIRVMSAPWARARSRAMLAAQAELRSMLRSMLLPPLEMEIHDYDAPMMFTEGYRSIQEVRGKFRIVNCLLYN